ncbi:hypothetical protein AY599_14435 [Leptolyngbya valderiana BDU 20041]|nr:hypothetical protein AY599_14435 [Leptolyngbya valderiana BDU 20041]
MDDRLPLTLHPPERYALSDEQFYELCAANRDLRLERNANGEIVIMPPTGGETGRRNTSIIFQLELWNRQTGLGVVFESSTGFRLPNGANRSPDAAWIPRVTWEGLSEGEREGFLPLCPAFVVELRSRTDRREVLQAKLVEYIENGAQLGWLVDPMLRQVAVYVPGAAVAVLENPATVSADPVLPGFVLALDEIF